MSKASDAPYDGLYQVAYVTNDFERALRQFGDTHRIAQFMQLPKMRYGTGPGREAVCNIALAYVGAIEIEVISRSKATCSFIATTCRRTARSPCATII